jgi:chorismate mutase
MKENQSNKTYETSLMALRQQIDEIDNKIISLLEQRMSVVDNVAELKKENNEKFFIRSNREADMIKDLLKKSEKTLTKNLVINIWRKIITAANMREQPLRIAIHNPKNCSEISSLVKQYYNELVPLHNFDSPTNVISAMQKNEAEIAIFALPNGNQEEKKEDAKENWWISLANNKEGLKVFAKIPFFESSINDIKNEKPQLVAIAAKNAEKSSDDVSLFYVEVNKEISKLQILNELKNLNLSGKILKSVKLNQVDGMIFCLVEVEGFYLENDEVVKNFMKSKIKPYVKILGHFARPIFL